MTKVTPKAVFEWRRLANELAPLYPSKNRGCRDSKNHRTVYAVIANMYGVHSRTVYRYLSPGPVNRSGYRNPLYLKRRYEKLYRRATRHIDDNFPQLFNGNPGLSLSELTGRIKEQIGISMRESTLEKLLGKYEGTERGPPVVKTESGGYKLNNSYYEPTL